MTTSRVHVHNRGEKAAATFFVFIILGPPIGAATLLLAAYIFWGPGRIGGSWKGTTEFVFLAFLFSYLLGGIQASIAGLMLALWGVVRGAIPLWSAIVVSLIVSTAVLVWKTSVRSDYNYSKEMLPDVLMHIVPTLICWTIVRRIWQRQAA